MKVLTVKIIAPTLIKGVGVEIGDILELDVADARLLIANNKAEKFTPPTPAGLTPEDIAAVVTQAKVELLEKIAKAADHAELETLLSEDPEIVAAYEKRVLELTDPDDADLDDSEPHH
jgi:hypothetical protein